MTKDQAIQELLGDAVRRAVNRLEHRFKLNIAYKMDCYCVESLQGFSLQSPSLTEAAIVLDSSK